MSTMNVVMYTSDAPAGEHAADAIAKHEPTDETSADAAASPEPSSGIVYEKEEQEQEQEQEQHTQPEHTESKEDVKLEEEAAAADDEEKEKEAKDKEEPREATFLDYLKSPVVELVIGTGDKQTVLSAHRAILGDSPFIKDITSQEGADQVGFPPVTPNTTPGRTLTRNSFPQTRVLLPDESVEAVACYLQYQYRGEYVVQSATSSSSSDATPSPGEDLLCHARVFFLASKLGHAELKRLARHKIHRVGSTPQGEIAYARYVYGSDSPDAADLRRPIANYWANDDAAREAVPDEFKAVCLEFPEFSYDILSCANRKRPASGTPGRERESARGEEGRKGPAAGSAAAKRRRSRRM
ncbi:hypothetical protein KEM52_002791 [Ascosphaera acerosa]|nr:hypothetical protein KEM52_002791 [Ascosphaera acerosa]